VMVWSTWLPISAMVVSGGVGRVVGVDIRVLVYAVGCVVGVGWRSVG
jgi:hypothetical protein